MIETLIALSVAIPARIEQAIHAASNRYGAPYSEMVTVARCESINFTDFYNEASGASGLFQFLPSTWRSTPYRHHSIFNHHWNAMAAGWLWRHDGRSWQEWDCQP